MKIKKRLPNIVVALIIGFSISLVMLPARINEYLNPGDDMITALIVQEIGLAGAIANRIITNTLFTGIIAFIFLSIFRRSGKKKGKAVFNN